MLRTRSTSTRRAGVLVAVALATTTFVALPHSAEAASNQLSVIEDSARVLSPNPVVQDAALDEIRDLDADVVKIPVIWRNVAPKPTSRRFPGVDLADPAAYDQALLAVIDRAILGAGLRGQRVWLMLTSPAPRWAVPREDASAPGSTQPDPRRYAEFAKAAGRHFASVEMWSVLNEPNLSLFLRPQFKNGVAVSAVHYRKIYRAGEAALRSAGHRGDTILFGELLPRAPKPRRANSTIPPLLWLRDFFCLDEELKPLAGAAAKARECNGFKAIRASGFAYHPYTTPRGPLIDDDRPDSATIQHLGRVFAVLDAAYRQKRLTQRKAAIFSSEFGFQSDPPDPDATPLRRIPEYLNVSEYLSFKNPRVATYSQYLLIDDTHVDAFQSGLRRSNGKVKPGVYDAYRLPIVVVNRSARTVTVWGKVRNSAARSVEIQADAGDGFEKVATVKINRRTGYFEGVVRGVDAAASTFRAVSGGSTSRQVRAIAAPSMLP